MVRKTTGVKKKKQKSWYTIVSPKVFGEKTLSETPSVDSKNIVGRKINVTLSDLTGDFKHFHTIVTLKVKEVKDLKAYTEYNGQSLISDKIARMVSRWRSRIDAVEDIDTKDDHKIRLKSIVITRKRVNTTVKSDIRKKVFEEARNYCKGKDLESIVSDIFSNKMQRHIFQSTKSIYPLQSVEIRKTEVLK